MPKYLLYIAIGLLLVFFIAIFYISRLKFNDENKDVKFSIKNVCPFEIFDLKRPNKFNPYISISLIGYLVAVILGLVYVIVFYSINYPNVIGLVVAISIFAICASIMVILLFTIQLIYVKTFIFTVSFFFAFVFFSTASTGSMLLTTNFTNSTAQFVVAIIELVLATVSIIMCFTPALRKFGKMELSKNEDGTVTVKRPKVIALALFEWIEIGVLTLGFLSLFILFIIL